MRRITVNINDGGQRLDKFVQKTVWGLPPSLMYKFIRTKKIKVNGKRAELSYRLNEGDTVDFYIPDEFFDKKTADSDFSCARCDFDILYEDENILLCVKKPGMLVHAGDEDERNSGENTERNTLLYQIKAYLYRKGEYEPENENSFSPSLCNRIDRNTGGIVIAAKNAAALREMNEEIKNGGVTKKYLCAVHGRMEKNSDVLRAYLFKDAKTKRVYVSDTSKPGSKTIVTEYEVLAYNRKQDLTLAEVTLHTGRTHQIRAHFSYTGHPLLGDGKYGKNKNDRETGWKHQALYSYKLEFHPVTDYFSYLDRKTFEVDKKNIDFLKLF